MFFLFIVFYKNVIIRVDIFADVIPILHSTFGFLMVESY